MAGLTTTQSFSDGDTVTFSGGGSDADDAASDLEALWQTGSDTVCDWTTLGEGGTTACDVTVSFGMSDVTRVVRDPGEALLLAQRAAELTERSNPYILDTLAAAHASAGQFDLAIDVVSRALELVRDRRALKVLIEP